MDRTFTDMKSNVGNNIQDTSTTMATIIGRYINDTYFDLLRRINWDIKDDDYSLNTTSGTQDYVLPANFGKPIYVYDATNDKTLSNINMGQLATDYATTLESSGATERYTILSRRYEAVPTSASVFAIVSSDSGDTTQTFYIRGISDGVEVTESVTLTGDTPVNSTNSYTDIISFSLSAATTGKVTVTSNSGAVTNAVIPPQTTDYKVKVIRFHQIPTQTLTINIPYIINPQPLLNDYDTPLIDVADILEQGATAWAWRYKRQFAKAQEWERLYEKGITQAIWNQENQPDTVKMFNPVPYSRDIY